MADAHIHDSVKQMIGVMTANGWRITEQRREMAVIFSRAEGYLSPKDVYDQMAVAYPA